MNVLFHNVFPAPGAFDCPEFGGVYTGRGTLTQAAQFSARCKHWAGRALSGRYA